MTLHREHGCIQFECDTCGDTLNTGELDFRDAKQVLDGDRWQTKKEDDEWAHYCPSCRSGVGNAANFKRWMD